MKKVIRLTESDVRRIVKSSVNRVLREYMFDNPLNQTDIDGEPIDDEDEDFTPEVGYGGDIDDLDIGMNGADDNIYGFKSPFTGLRGYNGDDREFLDNATYEPDFNYYDNYDDIDMDDSDYEKYIQTANESKRRGGSMITEKHRPSGVSKRIHTRDANGKKQSFDYIPNLPKYNKHQDFNQASKFQRINARPVEDPNGEDIDTVLKDGTIERKGLHLPQGYYNVNNVGGTEHWGIDPKTFAKKYEADPTQNGVYKPKGGPMLASSPLKRNTSFQAPWGGRMDMKAGSRILQDPNNPKDTYGIGGNEFDSTYKFDESRNIIGRALRESINNVLKEGGMYKNGMLTQDGVISVNNTNVGNRQKEFNKKYTPDFKKRKLKK